MSVTTTATTKPHITEPHETLKNLSVTYYTFVCLSENTLYQEITTCRF